MNPADLLRDVSGLTVGLGIVAGLAWTRRTGWGCGGIITPGLLALYAADLPRGLFALVFGAALTPLLGFVSRPLRLYGRERLAAAMLLALCLRSLLPPLHLPVDAHWIGWVVPGLIAADGQRQGLPMTLSGAVACACAAAFAAAVIESLGGLAL